MVVSYVAILVAAVVSFVIGMLWYSPLLFGKMWIRLSGIDKEKMEKNMKKGMGKVMLFAFIANLVMAYVLSYFINVLRYSMAVDGAILGFMIWLGFLATTLLGTVLWEGKPFGLYVINASYNLINLLIMGSIIAALV